MHIKKGRYSDLTAKIKYSIKEDIKTNNRDYSMVTGDNGVGKTRFIEGVLLKELKKQKIKTLYFSQDIENQILSFELISLVKDFITKLKKSGSFFKTVLFNDDAHNSIGLDFNSDEVLKPNRESICNFIKRQTKKFYSVEVVILDEVDKYFDSPDNFQKYLDTLEGKTVFLISHIIKKQRLKYNMRQLRLTKDITNGGVLIEQS